MHRADAIVCGRLNAQLSSNPGCSLTEHDLMAHLATAPEAGLRMSELATRLRVTPGGLTRIADRLAERGWIDRGSQPGNRREVYVRLTPEGLNAFKTARQVYGRVLELTLGARLTPDELRTLDKLTGKLLASPAIDVQHLG